MITHEENLHDTLPIVKSLSSAASMIHHKVSTNKSYIVLSYSSLKDGRRYGVSSDQRILTPGLFRKRYDLVRDCLALPLALTCAQREVVLRLLRLWAYYGKIYPKESQITQDPGCSKATFWRTVALLEQVGLLRRVNRYVFRPKAQISNLYLLHNLIVVIARYLAEHSKHVFAKWVQPYLGMTAAAFWGMWVGNLADRAGPDQSCGVFSSYDL